MANAITVEDVKREIDRVPIDKLEPLYRYIRGLSDIRPMKQSREIFMEKMSEVRIDAPADFASNIDDYLYGDKSLDNDLR